MHTSSPKQSPAEKGNPTTLSPEEIRHLAIGRSRHGYDRTEVDRLLTEIADSFEAVWHQRTTLYNDVQQLREQLKQQATTLADRQPAETDQSALLAELEHTQTELRELRAAGAQRHSEQGEQEQRSATELTRLQAEADRLRNERDRLLDETRRWTTVITAERKKLADFLLNALNQIEQVSTNGTTPHQTEPNDLQQQLRNEGLRPAELVFEALKIRDSDAGSC